MRFGDDPVFLSFVHWYCAPGTATSKVLVEMYYLYILHDLLVGELNVKR